METITCTDGLIQARAKIESGEIRSAVAALVAVFGDGFEFNEPYATLYGIGPVTKEGRSFHQSDNRNDVLEAFRQAIVVSKCRDAKRASSIA